MNAVTHAFFFYLVFIGVRLFTGGYHADTHFKCKLTLVICSLFVLLSSNQYEALGELRLHILFLATVDRTREEKKSRCFNYHGDCINSYK